MRFAIVFIGFILTTTLSANDAGQIQYELTATTTAERQIGLLIGDNLTLKIALPENVTVDERSLPQRQKRHGDWFYLKESDLKESQLIMALQVVNVPANHREVLTPSFELRTLSGELIAVTGATVQIGSFLPENALNSDGVFVSQPDIATTMINEQSWVRNSWLAAGVLLASLLIYVAWHIGLRPRRRLPFAHAVFALNKLRWFGQSDTEEASRILHAAFNQSADRVLVVSNLETLWQKCPWLRPLHAEISQFFTDSSAHFFSDKQAEQQNFNALHQLAKDCRRREKLA
ncbi:hypothetical protein Q7C_301 [Methylophaga frappieri]|uniref:MxaA protein n=1 Tax=Methylophaga frappieri (strain ATCC BAA-2434 / DSM 25690 / JAM7) TaxID=754477 RepID=I1YEY7_METFJ|nr:hypothetical protein [Methylophaga frappieri]AFJ01480.1 hypothetical protein Q7C_301 [Methylophaga frappieri]